jgi:hypothetical protein
MLSCYYGATYRIYRPFKYTTPRLQLPPCRRIRKRRRPESTVPRARKDLRPPSPPPSQLKQNPHSLPQPPIVPLLLASLPSPPSSPTKHREGEGRGSDPSTPSRVQNAYGAATSAAPLKAAANPSFKFVRRADPAYQRPERTGQRVHIRSSGRRADDGGANTLSGTKGQRCKTSEKADLG